MKKNILQVQFKRNFFIACMVICAIPLVQGQTYVDITATGTNNGSSWANAYNKLQDGIDNTSTGDSVWVAAGTYIPTEILNGINSSSSFTTNVRDKTFFCDKDIVILGGFAGTETLASQRNWTTNLTTLSGAVGGTDTAFHVVTTHGLTTDAVIDGFTISNGKADGTDYVYVISAATAFLQYFGGGMYNHTSSPTVSHVIFSDNKARDGGGMANYISSSPALSSTTFSENTATQYGGGIYNQSSSSPTISQSTFSDNIATTLGGGIFNFSFSSPTINSCTFSGNSSTSGGGICNNTSCSPIVINSTFSLNVASEFGGGILNSGSSSPTISYSTFIDNTADDGGGAINNAGSCSPSITNVAFSGNHSDFGGAIQNTNSSSPAITNSVFSKNSADDGGGAIYSGSSSPTIINSTFNENTATLYGGAMYNGTSTSTTVRNCIFWGNKKGASSTDNNAELYNANIASSTYTSTYTLYQLASTSYTSGNFNEITGGAGNVYASDPKFVYSTDPDGADDIWMTADDGLQLLTGSPALDVGNNASIPSGITTDILDSARIQSTTVDMGAYEGESKCNLQSELPKAIQTYASVLVAKVGTWNCYCDAEGKLLLALDTTGTGAVIDDTGVGLQIGTDTTTSWSASGGLISNAKGGAIIKRKWDVTPITQPTSDVKVRFFFRQDEYTAIKDTLANHNAGATGYPTTLSAVTGLQMYKLNSGGFGDPHASGAAGGVLPNGSTASSTTWKHGTYGTVDHYAEFLVSSFSGGGAGAGGGSLPLGSIGALPVELIHFNAKAAPNHSAALVWATATETNNSHFEILRSYDGSSFETIDVVKGNGTTHSVVEYSYSDRSLDLDKNTAYYRLRQVDYDGASELTEVRKVNFDNEVIIATNIVAYPNPTNGKLYVSLGSTPNTAIEAQVLDANGRVLDTHTLRQSVSTVDIGHLTNGIYFVRFTIDQEVHYLKVTKM